MVELSSGVSRGLCVVCSFAIGGAWEYECGWYFCQWTFKSGVAYLIHLPILGLGMARCL